MRKLMLIILCFSNLSLSLAQIQIIQQGSIGEYYLTYYKDMIEKNNVSSIKISICDDCSYSNKKKDSILYREDFFNTNGNLYKEINYKKNGKIYSVDSFSYVDENSYELIYKSKNGKSFRPTIKCFKLEEEENILNSKEIQHRLIKDKFTELLFCNNNNNDIHIYSLTKNKMQFLYLYDYDNHNYFKKIIRYDTEFKTIDTIDYKLDYENLNGKSIRRRDNISYLYSVILFDNNNRIIKENFFDIPYNIISVKNFKDIRPNTTIVYHYKDNGLFDFIEFLNFIGNRSILFFQYKYFDK